MITMTQEEGIREFLNDTSLMTDRYIASAVGVDDSVVSNIRRVINIIRTTPIEKIEEIRRLFLSGLTPNAIMVAAKVSRSTVMAVRRFYYLQPRKPGDGGPRKCPTCGSMMFGVQDKAKQPSETKKSPPIEFYAKEALALYKIVDDVCKLDRLCIVREPAFYYLARRAETLLEKIHGKSPSDR